MDKKPLNSKAKALSSYKEEMRNRILAKRPRMLSESEQKEKTKDWPKSSDKKVDTVAYQQKYRRAYND